jgi:hypothetical protein
MFGLWTSRTKRRPGSIADERAFGPSSMRFGAAGRRELLLVLESPVVVRADLIRQFYERPEVRDMAELLIECESNELVRSEIIEALRTRLD